MAYSDFSVTQGNNISAGNQNQNMINIRHLVSGTNATATPSATENIKQLRTDVDSKDVIPVGTIFSYGSTTVPSDYFTCDGSSLNKTTYSELFNIIGFSFGGTGNTYSLPDTKASHIRGVGASTIFTQNQTITLGQTINDSMQGHIFEVYRNTDTVGGGSYGTPTLSDQDNDGSSVISDPNSIGITSSAITDGVNGTPRIENETRPNAIGLNFIIKYQ